VTTRAGGAAEARTTASIAIRLELMRLTETDSSVERAVEDYYWGV